MLDVAEFLGSIEQHKLRSSLSFTAKDIGIVSDYDEKGRTAAWVRTGLATAITSHAVTSEVCIHSSRLVHDTAQPSSLVHCNS